VGTDQLLDDRPQAGVQEHQRPGGDVRRSPAFREAFASRRCVVPADGFFEWTGPKEDRRPIWFHRPDGGLILFAGLYETWRPSPAGKERTFTIITTTPNALLEPVHNRMPVILEDEAVDDWLYARQTPGSLMKLLRPVRDDYLVGTPVSARANSVKNERPRLPGEGGGAIASLPRGRAALADR